MNGARDLRRLCRLDGSDESLLESALALLPAAQGEVFRVAARYHVDEGAQLDSLVTHRASRETTLAAFASIASTPSPFLVRDRGYTSITASQTWSDDMERGINVVGCADFVGCVMNLRGGYFAALGAGMSQPVAIPRPASSTGRNVRTLLKANLMLRHVFAGEGMLENAGALLDPDGRLLSATDPLLRPVRDNLSRAVRARETAGAFDACAPGAAIQLWHDLVVAKLVLLDFVDTDRRRYVIALRLSDGPIRSLSLSAEEKLVLERMLIGQSNKVIADSRGVSCATVSITAARALRKLGVRSVAEIGAVARSRNSLVLSEWSLDGEVLGALGYSSTEAEAFAALSPNERAVTQAALSGRSAREIALVRGISVRTVANQLASSYRKLGVSGRRELMAKLARRG